RYRFPMVRATWLAKAVTEIHREFGSLRSLLGETHATSELRRKLVARVAGMGPKQASMFLRDIGVAKDVAIIDSHVMRFMDIVLGDPVDTRRIGRITTYEMHEMTLSRYATYWRVGMSELDRAIWAVM